MTLVSLGSLPGSQLHVGMEGAWTLLRLRIGDLDALTANAQRTIEAIATPDLDLGELTAGFDLSPDILADIVADLPTFDPTAQLEADIGALNVKLGNVQALAGNIDAALSIGGIQAWGYEGASSRFAPLLSAATTAGFGDVDPTTEVSGLVLASSSATNWATLSGALNTGYGSFSGQTQDSSGQAVGELRNLGQLPGTSLLVGLGLTAPALALEIEDIIGQLAQIVEDALLVGEATAGVTPFSLETSLSSALGGVASFSFGMPSASLTVGADIGIELALALGLRAALAPVTTLLEATINGGGVQAWSYQGTLRGLGQEFQSITTGGIAGGLPTDKAHGLVLASSSSVDWEALGKVLRVS